MVIQKFKSYLKNERRYSHHTINAYLSDLNQFFQFLNILPKNIDAITAFDIREWLVFLKQKNLLSKTINRKISSLKTFFHFCEIEFLLVSNPSQKIRILKEKKRLPIVVSEESLVALFAAKNIFPDNFTGIRDKFILDLFYQSGIRLSELINLDLNDFDRFNRVLRILGKRNKERIIPLTDSLISTFDTYINLRSQIDIIHANYLFVTKNGHKTYEKMIYRIVNYYLSKFSSLKKTSPHVLRHAFATHLLNRGADLNVIKELLGHSSLMSTQVYTHVSSKKIKSIYRSTHPRG